VTGEECRAAVETQGASFDGTAYFAAITVYLIGFFRYEEDAVDNTAAPSGISSDVVYVSVRREKAGRSAPAYLPFACEEIKKVRTPGPRIRRAHRSARDGGPRRSDSPGAGIQASVPRRGIR